MPFCAGGGWKGHDILARGGGSNPVIGLVSNVPGSMLGFDSRLLLFSSAKNFNSIASAIQLLNQELNQGTTEEQPTAWLILSSLQNKFVFQHDDDSVFNDYSCYHLLTLSLI